MKRHQDHAGNPGDKVADQERPACAAASERKYVTVLFSDLCGYTALSERLDPEELHEIMGSIFRETEKIITKYEGFIEKFVGDAVIAFFGVPAAHEDDCVRAILAAREIHRAVASLNPGAKIKEDLRLSMHSGISSGLVVTGTLNPSKGNYGISGDTINLAARLQELAQPGDILVCTDTCRESQGYFTFEPLSPVKVKGRSEPVVIKRVLSAYTHPRKKTPLTVQRGALIGREQEMSLLLEAADRLRKGTGAAFFICGDAGTGKSRLVDDFRSFVQQKGIEWFQGCAHAYSRDISYAPFKDLLHGMLGIEEGSPPDMAGQKIEHQTGLKGDLNRAVLACLGSLDSDSCSGTGALEPELWKSRLHRAIRTIFTMQAQRSPTVICLEDIHWADPSSAELIHTFLADGCSMVLFICTLRPTTRFPPGRKPGRPDLMYREITLTGLSPEESRELLKSLLTSSRIPPALESFILGKVEGNPFYLEEMLNALIESATLVKTKGAWQLTRPLTHSGIPRTVHGLIASRIDCLHPTAKRILQVGSVMGKSFSRTLLTTIIDGAEHLEDHLEKLEQDNLIRLISAHPDPEYSFRHAILQEVAYSSLLKKERQEMHERIGRLIESLFPDRVEALAELLAFHFKQGQSPHKATHYLLQSGKKSLQQYAVNESHQYYGEAYALLGSSGNSWAAVKKELIGLLNAWAPVFYFRGTFRDLEELLRRHLPEADTLDDLEKRGIFYVWLGASLWGGEQFGDAYRFLHRALELGERSSSTRVNAYAHTWLAWTCVELGRIQEGIMHGKEARVLSASTAWEHYPYFQSYDSDGYAYWALGACAQIKASGKKLRELGLESASIRGITWGYTVEAWGFLSAGDFPSALSCTKIALKTSKDPLYTQFPRLSLGMCYVLYGDYEKAKKHLMEVMEFAENRGCRYLGTPSQCFLAAVLAAEGRFSAGMRMLRRAQRWWHENQALWRSTFSELIIGNIYAALAHRSAPISWSCIARNSLFLAQNLPFAAWKAHNHYLKAIESAHLIGAQVIEGLAYLSLGRLYKRGGKNRQAAACLSSACRLFELCEAGDSLEQVRQELTLVQRGKEKSSCR